MNIHRSWDLWDFSDNFYSIEIYAVATSSLKFYIERCPNNDFLLIYLQKDKDLILAYTREYLTSHKFHVKELEKRNKNKQLELE
jgi:hypothetical protein